jgi:hypothetical protein
MSHSEIEGLRFDLRHPREFTATQFLDVEALRQQYYRGVLPKSLPDSHIASFVLNTTRRSWENPNRSPDRTSRRANPRVVTASDPRNDRLVGMIYVAEDASGSHLGIVEEIAKLKADTLAKFQLLPPNLTKKLGDHCFLWAREAIVVSDQPLVLETMAALATHARFNDQLDHPVSCYPWDGEESLQRNLLSLDFREIGKPKLVKPIPGSDIEIGQHRLECDSRVDLNGLIMSFPGVGAAVDRALSQIA